MYSFTKAGEVLWESEVPKFMPDPTIPRWSVDSNAHPNPFYESDGAHIIIVATEMKEEHDISSSSSEDKKNTEHGH
jgi:hypothetical protein